MATQTGFIDLMGFARGQELGNQMNWRDVLNDISSRQAEQNLQQQQQAWALALPGAQERAQSELDAIQARREAGMAQADLFQRAAALPEEQRAQFMAEDINRRMRSLNPSVPAGAAQIQGFNNMLVGEAQRAAQRGDTAGAQRLLAQAAALTSPLAGQDQQRAYNEQMTQMLQERFGANYFMADPRTGAPVNLIPTMTGVQQFERLFGGAPASQPAMPQVSSGADMPAAPLGVPPQNPQAIPAWLAANLNQGYSAAPTGNVQTTPVAAPPVAVPAGPTPQNPYQGVRWQDVFNPVSASNSQLRSDIWKWLTPATAATPSYSYQPTPFGGGFR